MLGTRYCCAARGVCGKLRAALLASTTLVAVGSSAAAQDATWLANPGSGYYNAGANWSTGTSPFGTAFFGTSSTTSLTFPALLRPFVDVGGWTFNPGADNYTFDNTGFLSFNGAGIVINGGSVTITNNSSLTFSRTSTAGTATITNNVAVSFYTDSAAGNAAITNNRYLEFHDRSTAGNATVTNNAEAHFYGDSTAGNATITNNVILSFDDFGTAGDAAIANNGLLSFFTNSTAGNAAITNNASGLVDFSGTTGLAGDRKLSAGSIAGAGAYNLGANALTVGSNSLSTEVSGVISGAGGALVKTGNGTLTLTGVNTYSGGTTLAGGTVSVSSDANLGEAAGALTFNGGTLQVTGTAFTSTARTINWSAAGGGFDIANAANTFTVSQSLGDAGGLTKLGAGTLVLSGANGYRGGTTVSDGALQLGDAVTAGSLIGAVNVVGTSSTFSVVNAGTSDITSITNDGSVSFSNSTSASNATITNNKFLTFQDNSTAGRAVIANNGVTSFRGSSTADGATITNNDSLLFYDSSTAGGAAIINNAGGSVDFSGSTGPAGDGKLTAGSIAGAGNYILGANQLTVGSNRLSVAVSGVISGVGGSLVKIRSGTLTLTGANTYTGGTTISAGRLQLGDGGGIGAVLGAVTVGASGTFDVFNANTGGITGIANTGITNFSNSTSAANAAITNSGTLNFSDASTAGSAAIANTSALLFSGTASAGSAAITNDGLLSFSNAATAGGATIASNGLLNFRNAATAGSATIINDGNLYLYGTSTAGNAAITNSGDLNFQNASTAGRADITNTRNLYFWDASTAGSAAIANGGNLYLYDTSTAGNAAIANSASGTVDFSSSAGAAGDHKLSAGSIAGAGSYLLGSNELTVGGNNLSTEVSGVISGAGGSLVKTGTGTLILSGVNTHTGATTVDGGTLAVNGSILSSSGVTVNAGGTLGGTGNVGNTTIMSGGNLAAGNSIGTLTVNGNLTFNGGGTYTVEVSPSASDLTKVVGGTATLTGATVQAVALAGSFRGQTYTILNAGGGLGGTEFAGLNVTGSFSPARNPHLTYDANSVFLVLDPGSIALPAGASGNPVNVAGGINRAVENGATPPAGFDALLNMTGARLDNALAQVSGEPGATTAQASFNATNQFFNMLLDPSDSHDGAAGGATAVAAEGEPLGYAAVAPRDTSRSLRVDPFAAPWRVWAGGYRGSSTVTGNAATGSHDTTSRIYGTVVGADYRLSPDTRLGFALGGAGFNVSTSGGLGSGRADLFQAGVYARHSFGSAYVAAAAAYGWQDVTTDRTVTIAGTDRLDAQFQPQTFALRGETGYRFAASWLGVTPYAAVQATSFHLPAYAEKATSGSNQFALSYAAQTTTNVRTELGAHLDKSFVVAEGLFTLRGRLAWGHDTDTSASVAAAFQSLPGATFTVNGAQPAADSALVTAGAEMNWRNGFSLGGSFEGEFSDSTRGYAGKGTLRYAW
jgi:autotransporter-associated beta strand protein